LAFEDAKDRDLARCSSSALSLAFATKLAFIQLKTAVKHVSTLVLQMVGHRLPNFLVKMRLCSGEFQAYLPPNVPSLPAQKIPTAFSGYFSLICNWLSCPC